MQLGDIRSGRAGFDDGCRDSRGRFLKGCVSAVAILALSSLPEALAAVPRAPAPAAPVAAPSAAVPVPAPAPIPSLPQPGFVVRYSVQAGFRVVPAGQPQTSMPVDINAVARRAYDPASNWLRIEATPGPSGTHTPSDANQVFTSIFDADSNAIHVVCVSGCNGNPQFGTDITAIDPTHQKVIGLGAIPLSPAAPVDGQVYQYSASLNRWVPANVGNSFGPGNLNQFLGWNGSQWSALQPAFDNLTGTAADAQLASPYSGVGPCPAHQFAIALARNVAPICSAAVTASNGSAGQFATGITPGGALTYGQPSFANLSGAVALNQTPLTTNGDLLTVSGGALSRLGMGSANQCLQVDGTGTGYVFGPCGGSTTFGTDLAAVDPSHQKVVGFNGFPLAAATPLNGQVYQYNAGQWTPQAIPASGGDTAVQYDDGGTPGGDSTNFFYTKGSHALAVIGPMTASGYTSTGTPAGCLSLNEQASNGANAAEICAPGSIPSTVKWTWPAADGTVSANSFLKTDGAGNLSFVQYAASATADTTNATNIVSGMLAVAQGGTGQGSRQAAFDSLAPAGTRSGDLPYWNGTHYVTLAGNNSGTNCFQESGSGVPSWAACGSGAPGGSNGQLQINSSSTFGGITLGGDCTFSTPNITCTKTNNSAFAASATTDTTDATNIVSGTLALARGGTGQGTQQAAFDSLAPAATRAGDMPYWNGTHYVTLAGNNSGTNCFQESGSGVPSWAACGSGSLGIGSGVGSGTANSALFVDGSGNLGQDNAHFNYNSGTQTLFAQNLSLGGNGFLLGTANQSTYSKLALYGAAPAGSNTFPPVLDFYAGLGNNSTKLMPDQNQPGMLCVGNAYLSASGGHCPTSAGAGTGIYLAEGTAPTSLSGLDAIYADSTAHALKVCLNGAACTTLGGGSGPGGSSGQLQINSSSTFGGITLGGDCTFSTPNITCTKTNGTSFAASAITDTTNAGNIASGTLNAARLPTVSTWEFVTGTSGSGSAAGAINTEYVWAFPITGVQVSTGHLVFVTNTIDASNPESFALYDSSGNLVANIAANEYSSGIHVVAWVQGTVVLPPGLYYLGFTSVGSTYKYLDSSSSMLRNCAAVVGGATSGGASLTGTPAFTPPAATWVNTCNTLPQFALDN